MFKRREFIKASAAVSTLVGLGSLGRSIAHLEPITPGPLPQKEADLLVHLRVYPSFRKASRVTQTLLEVCDFLSRESQGAIQGRISPYGTPVEEGELKVTVSSPSLHKGPSTVVPFFSRLPHGLQLEEKKRWLTSEVGQGFWDQAYAQAGLKPFYFGQGPAREYQVLSRSPEEMLQSPGYFLTKNSDSARARISGREVLPMASYRQLIVSSHLPFVSDGLPASVLVDKGLHRELHLRYVASDFLSSSVFNWNIRLEAWNKLPQDIKNLLQQASAFGAERLTAQLHEKENEAKALLQVEHNAEWSARSEQESHEAYARIARSSTETAEIARQYETFRRGGLILKAI